MVSEKGKAKKPRSMTGFARASQVLESSIIEIDVRSVNARHLELSLKLPRVYQPWEGELRAIVGSYLIRGRVDLSIVRNLNEKRKTLRNGNTKEEITPLVKAYTQLCQEFKAGKEGLSFLLADLLLKREATSTPEEIPTTEKEKAALFKGVEKALQQLVSMREKEGQALARDITERIKALTKLHSKIASEASEAPKILQERLLTRVAKLTTEVTLDPSRLAVEVALLADRTDVSEELVRLTSHFDQIHGSLRQSGEGKRLDFLLQECNREFNTIGSKAQRASVQTAVVDSKVILEKIREQVQNLE